MYWEGISALVNVLFFHVLFISQQTLTVFPEKRKYLPPLPQILHKYSKLNTGAVHELSWTDRPKKWDLGLHLWIASTVYQHKNVRQSKSWLKWSLCGFGTGSLNVLLVSSIGQSSRPLSYMWWYIAEVVD